jgi:hypothetical protein
MPTPKRITEPKQLIVEGADAVYFFRALLKHLDLTGIQIQNFGGIGELRAFLKALCNAPDFLTLVTSVGIVRDAETDASAAFQSVCSALNGANLTIPQQPMTPIGDSPQVNVLILPDATTSGMLETLCLRTVENDPVMECIEQYFNCIKQRRGILPTNMPKAKVQAFLASRPKPGLLLGQAADAGYWLWESLALEPVKQFLQVL